MIRLDGSRHSGSGTLVRTAVALAAVAGLEVEITDIRARREPSGLRSQHLRAAQAVARAAGGSLEGARLGSERLVFRPGAASPLGSAAVLDVDIGTAGSAVLAALALLPVAALGGPSKIKLRGGLFQDFAPSAFHLRDVLLPLLSRMGLSAEAVIHRPGYVPRGEGLLGLMIQPRHGLGPLRLPERGRVRAVHGTALASRLKNRSVAERMAQSCGRVLREAGLKASFELWDDETAVQPGAALACVADCERTLLGADQAGKLGRTSEEIGRSVAEQLLQDLSSPATVDRHAADMLIPFMALAEGESEIIVPQKSEHVDSNLWMIGVLLGADSALEPLSQGGFRLTVKGIGWRRSA